MYSKVSLVHQFESEEITLAILNIIWSQKNHCMMPHHDLGISSKILEGHDFSCLTICMTINIRRPKEDVSPCTMMSHSNMCLSHHEKISQDFSCSRQFPTRVFAFHQFSASTFCPCLLVKFHLKKTFRCSTSIQYLVFSIQQVCITLISYSIVFFQFLLVLSITLVLLKKSHVLVT